MDTCTDSTSSGCPAESELDTCVSENAPNSFNVSISQSTTQPDLQTSLHSDTGVRTAAHSMKLDGPEDIATFNASISLVLSTKKHRQWRDIAKQWHLGTDTQVACFLLQHFQETRRDGPYHCSTCDSPAVLCCSKCSRVLDATTSIRTSLTSDDLLAEGTNASIISSSEQRGPDLTDADNVKQDRDSGLEGKTEAGLCRDRSWTRSVPFSEKAAEVDECRNDSTENVSANAAVEVLTRTPPMHPQLFRVEDAMGLEGLHQKCREMSVQTDITCKADVFTFLCAQEEWRQIIVTKEEKDIDDSENRQTHTEIISESKQSCFAASDAVIVAERHPVISDPTAVDGKDLGYRLPVTNEADDTHPQRHSITTPAQSNKALSQCFSSIAIEPCCSEPMTTRQRRPSHVQSSKVQVASQNGSICTENDDMKDLTCERCGMSFNTVHAHRQHMQKPNCKRGILRKNMVMGKSGRRKTEKSSGLLSEKRLPQTLHKCNVCGKSFFERKMLRAHVRQHIGERPFSCTVCYATFKSAGVLKEHVSTHATDKTFPCEKCSKKYRTRKDLLTHQRHCHRNEKPFTCSVCGKDYKTRGSLNFHMKSHDGTKPVEKKFVCSTCGDAFARKSTLQNHVLRHTGEKPHVCSTCGAAFNALSTLTVHKRSHSGERPYVCSECNASFIQSSDLGKHMKRKHSDEKPFECTVCHLKYATRGDLNKHLVNCMHKRPKGRQRQSCVCDLCGAVFKDANYLRVHKMRHLGQKPFVCDECGWSFVVNSELQAHMKVHSGHKPFICDQCGSSFFNAGSLRKHQRKHISKNSSHAMSESTTGYVFQADAACGISLRDITCGKSEAPHNENKFLCSECGQSCKTQASFSDHLKQHSLNQAALLTQADFAEVSKQQTRKKSVERNFICTTCGAAFGKKSILQNHILRHTGAKPHICSICSAAFRALSTLIVHRRSHSGEKPYVCPQCDAAFIQSSDLNKHMKRNHGDYRPHECKLCGSRYATKKDLNQHFKMHAL